MTRIAILGLGEAGRIYGRGLASSGAQVRGYDPFLTAGEASIDQIDELSDAVACAEVILSLVGGAAATAVADQALSVAPAECVYADLNTAGPDVKHAIGQIAADRGIPMADVAVLAPVPRDGHRTPLLASGSGAALFAERTRVLGAPVEVLEGPAGEAARMKLLRSVFMKGLATLVIEGVTAAQVAGAEPWLRAQMAQELGPDGAALVARLIEGTYQHAERREHEVRDALDAVRGGGTPTDMTEATLKWFERILADRPAATP